ncbi:ATP-binding cassette domain-containing protein, partial [Acinetobacter baumannii]
MSAEAATHAEPNVSGMRPMLTADRLRMSFGGVVALNEVSIEIRPDELIAVIGPNGAGKTSLMNCMSGFYRPQQGRIVFD